MHSVSILSPLNNGLSMDLIWTCYGLGMDMISLLMNQMPSLTVINRIEK